MPSDQGPIDPRRAHADRADPERDDAPRHDWDEDDGLGPVHEQRPASDYYDDDPYDDYDDGPRLLARRLVQGGIALLAVVLFLGVVWYAYTWGSRGAATGDVPVVAAQDRPEKVEPEDPGGMDVPHQDKLVLNQDGAGGDGQVERLLPPPEEPRPPERTQEPRQAEGQGAPAPDGGDGGGEQVADLPETTVPDQDMPETDADGSAAAPAVSEPGDTGPSDPATAGSDTAGATAGDGEADTDATEPAADADAPTRTPGRKPGGDGSGSGERTQTAAAEPAQSASEAQAAPADAPADGRYAVQIAAFQSEQAARNAWATYQQRFPDILSGQRLLLQNAQVNNQTYWRVRTGPFAERSAAQELCDRLKARDQSCLPVTR
jgi:cell division septation protein DedD